MPDGHAGACTLHVKPQRSPVHVGVKPGSSIAGQSASVAHGGWQALLELGHVESATGQTDASAQGP
jgi:hypothetical protein